MDFARRVVNHADIKISLVTPFLTPKGLNKVRVLIDGMLERLGELEVVCSDWGLLYDLRRHQLATPVVGRLLVAQITDPRIIRMTESGFSAAPEKQIRHMDGTPCILKTKTLSSLLQRHYRSCWTDKPDAIAFLSHLGIDRCELSNAAQGIELTFPGLCYTLHVPEVLVTVMRNCPGDGENFNTKSHCPCKADKAVRWSNKNLPFDLFRRDNALYYNWAAYPDNLDSLPVDRIVL